MNSFASTGSGRRSVRRVAAWAALLLGAQAPSFADQLGYRAYQQTWDPATPSVTNVNPGLALYGGLSTDLVNAWNTFAARAKQNWTADLSAPNFAGEGYTLENPVLVLGGVDSTEMRVAAVQDSVAPAGFQSPSTTAPVLVIHSTGTRLDAGSTVPFLPRSVGIAPFQVDVGDPTFHITFDLTAYIRLGVGPRVNAVSVSNAVVVLTNAQYFPDNAVAKDGQLLAPLQNLFGARSFAQRVSDSINGQVVNITGYLGSAIQSANAELRQQAPPGYVVAGIFADSQWLNIVLAPHLQPNSGGQMYGTLTVSGLSRLPPSQRTTSTSGTPPDCSKVFSLADTVQVQPDYVGSLNPTSFLKGSGPTMPLDSQIVISGGTIQSAADGWSCRYSVGGLADKFLNNLHFNEPSVASNGSLPTVGYVIDVGFQGCNNSTSGSIPTTSAVACLSTPGLCSSALTPENGSPLNCNLVGMIQLSSSSGVGVAKASAFANQSLSPGSPVESKTVAPSVWGAQAVNRSTTSAAPAIQWGSAASAPAVTLGSSLNRNASSSLQQAQSSPAPAAPTAVRSTIGSQF